MYHLQQYVRGLRGYHHLEPWIDENKHLLSPSGTRSIIITATHTMSCKNWDSKTSQWRTAIKSTGSARSYAIVLPVFLLPVNSRLRNLFLNFFWACRHVIFFFVVILFFRRHFIFSQSSCYFLDYSLKAEFYFCFRCCQIPASLP